MLNVRLGKESRLNRVKLGQEVLSSNGNKLAKHFHLSVFVRCGYCMIYTAAGQNVLNFNIFNFAWSFNSAIEGSELPVAFKWEL